jgi:hypothetical protein
LLPNKRINDPSNYGRIMYFETDRLRYSGQPSDTFPLDKLAEELIFKGALFLGAGLGLYIALRIFGKDPSKDSEYYIC